MEGEGKKEVGSGDEIKNVDLIISSFIHISVKIVQPFQSAKSDYTKTNS